MQDNNPPTIDLSFIVNCLLECPKIDSSSKVSFGNVVMFALSGDKPLHKRMVILTHDDEQVDYETASGLASRFRFLGAFLDWLRINRGWNEGGYSTRKMVNLPIIEEADEEEE